MATGPDLSSAPAGSSAPPASPVTAAEAAHDRYRSLLELWSRENPIKTAKLQVLLAVNALLVSVAALSGGGFEREHWPVYVAGAAFSLVWTLSIGRTALFQDAWARKLDALAAEFPDDPRFHIHRTRDERRRAPAALRVLGGVSSRYYLLAAPPILAAAWLVVLVVALAGA